MSNTSHGGETTSGTEIKAPLSLILPVSTMRKLSICSAATYDIVIHSKALFLSLSHPKDEGLEQAAVNSHTVYQKTIEECTERAYYSC